MKLPRIALAWLGATLVTAATGSIIQTQFNLAAIKATGAPVPFDLRLQTTLQDLVGFAPMLAGIAAVTTATLLMNVLLPLTVIGATRSLPGVAALGASGALGGRVYAWLAPAPTQRGMA
ncbi:MAG: hypothetical protein ACNA8G_07100 [Gammaproteobacteria bacterium]